MQQIKSDGQAPDRDLRFFIESPVPATEPHIFKSRSLEVSGWCFDAGGDPLTAIRARIGEEKFSARRKLPRFDVWQMFQEYEQARFSGFVIPVTLRPGWNTVEVECRCPDKIWRRLGTLRCKSPRFSWPWQKLDTPIGPDASYANWIQSAGARSSDNSDRVARHIAAFPRKPQISVLLPTFNPDPQFLRKCIESVRAQTYPEWQLCIADDSSSEPHVREILEEYAAADPRISLTLREVNGHITEASNSALALATGEFVALLDHDDEIPCHALHLVADAILKHPDATLIYSDEDKIDEEGVRFDPHFKPDWNPELLLSQNYISHLGVYRTKLVRKAGGFRKGYEGSQDWDLALRISREPGTVIHIPHILYHWRTVEGSTSMGSQEKPYVIEAGLIAVKAHFEVTGPAMSRVEVQPGGTIRWTPALPDPPPSITLIVPTKNQLTLLRRCIDSLRLRTRYQGLRILVLNHASDDPATVQYLEGLEKSGAAGVLRMDGPFNYSKLNNAAVRHCDTAFVGLINNDIEALHDDWLVEMVSLAAMKNSGAVGARLLFPDGRVQHAGVFLGFQGTAGHLSRGMIQSVAHHGNRLNVTHQVSAVTAACLVIKRDKYFEVGGFDELQFPVTLNDVDLCLKLQTAGYKNLYCPWAVLKHHESASRDKKGITPSRRDRNKSEIAEFQKKWARQIEADPFYNPNLSLGSEDYALAFPTRARLPWLDFTP